MSYPFGGEEEERRAIQWMIYTIRGNRSKNKDQQNEADDLKKELHTRLDEINQSEGRASAEWYDDLWDRFIFAMSGVWLDDAGSDWEPPYGWGEWDLQEAQELGIGHSKYLIRTIVPKGGGSAIHLYTRPPQKINWSLMPIDQKKQTFYIGKAKVSEIDAICSVPQLPTELDSEEAGLRVLNRRRGEKEWQRRVEARRVLSIRNFISDSNNIIANSAILYAPNHPSITYTKSGKVTIDFTKFLKAEKGVWTDHSMKRDLRPIWLIDGQHRTRGLAQSAEGIDLEIPIILFPPAFSLSQSAKIFAEINTLQKKLSPLHTLFMQHRFGIPSPVSKRDFRRPWKPEKSTTWDSRANHLSYECAAFLTSNPEGPLYQRIRILDQNPPRFPIIQASQWLDFSRYWFLEGGIYGPDSDEDQEHIQEEVENYFRAFVSTCNHGEWNDNRPRWPGDARQKSLVQRQGPSQSLLRLYPTAWELTKRGRSIVTEGQFFQTLKPLKWVDWLDSRLKIYYGGSGERPRTALRIWMENALRNGESYPWEEVMAKDIKSEAGKGMLSPPGDSVIEAKGPEWPRKNAPVVLVAKQPLNTLSGSKWTIYDSNGINRSPENDTIFVKQGIAEYRLNHEPWMDQVDYLDIRVDWYNTVAPPGKGILRLEKPS